jgi:SAM-dependent methyltransferase
MQTSLIQRHYDEVIAPHYDLDPQSVIGNSLDRAIAQIRCQHLQLKNQSLLNVLDIGMGTGRFLNKLKADAGLCIQPFGLDLSEKMIDLARERIPDLVAVVEDAANLDVCFPDQAFDIISTHFVTGFVPIDLLAPKIWGKLKPGGYWSLIGGTKAGFPALQRKAQAKNLRWLYGGKTFDVDELVNNPSDRFEVIQSLENAGFEVKASETFTPKLSFADLNEFLEFGYFGGWLTPFIEALGLHKAKPPIRLLLNALVFPIDDQHCIEIALAQKI